MNEKGDMPAKMSFIGYTVYFSLKQESEICKLHGILLNDWLVHFHNRKISTL